MTLRDLEDFAGIASDWFWETDEEHRFTYFSARMEQVTHVRAQDLLGRRRDQQILTCENDQTMAKHRDDLKHRRPFRDLEYCVARQMRHGKLWLRVSGDPVFDSNGTFKGYRGAGHDITAEKAALERLSLANDALTAKNAELQALREQLERAAYADTLTGLPNRRAFDQNLTETLSDATAHLALMIIDLDRFKYVNDTLGHLAGDMVLVTAARRIAGLCGPTSKVFRIGGDEFAILQTGCSDPKSVASLGQAIVRDVSAPIALHGQDVDVGASVGFALSKGRPTSGQYLFAQADSALYAAKRGGRNQVSPHSDVYQLRMQKARP